MTTRRLLSSEAAEAPGTPTAKAKRPLLQPQPGSQGDESASSGSPDQATAAVPEPEPGTAASPAAAAAHPAHLSSSSASSYAPATADTFVRENQQQQATATAAAPVPAAEASESAAAVVEGDTNDARRDREVEDGHEPEEGEHVLPNGDHAEASAAIDPAELERQAHLEQASPGPFCVNLYLLCITILKGCCCCCCYEGTVCEKPG